jgi:hypothetical protein
MIGDANFTARITSLVLLIEHRRVAFPTLGRVPRTDRSIVGFVGFTTGNTQEQDTQQEQ